MKQQHIILGACVVLMAIVAFYAVSMDQNGEKQNMDTTKGGYIPQPDLSQTELKGLPVASVEKRVDLKVPIFSNPTIITHPLFPVNNLSHAILLGNDDGRPLQVVYTLLPESMNKTIDWNGQKIETRTVQYLAYFDRRLIESAYDWYAQADDGSVWYFGEVVTNYADGKVTDNHGTWLAEKDGPIAMIMPADPKVGDVYRVENIPGVAFEEVEVKSMNTTAVGPLGEVRGCMVGSQLHDNGSYSDKTFCPGYGEFFTQKDLDLEAVALALPVDALAKQAPAELATMMSSALLIHDSALNNDWNVVARELSSLKVAWNALQKNPDGVSVRLGAQMERAIESLEGDALEPGALARYTIGTQNGALDVAFAALDLERRYRATAEIELASITLWARKTIIDANALEQGFVLSDARAFEFLIERVKEKLSKGDADQLEILVKQLATAADKEDFKKIKSIASQLATHQYRVISQGQLSEQYDPKIIPADFSTQITNKYFSLPIGKKMVYEARTEEGKLERVEISILNETKIIEGVATIIYLDRVYNDGQLVEETRDYLAQHKNGDVWYFGEEVDNYENGKLKDHHGSFIHGKNGAKAGIWMKASQKVGDTYRQEYFKGEAEDVRDTVVTGLTVVTKKATYVDCVKVYDWTPLDLKSREHKYYCSEVGGLVLNEHLETGKRSELVSVTMP